LKENPNPMNKTLKDVSNPILRSMFVDAVAEHQNPSDSDDDNKRAINASRLIRQVYRELRTRDDGIAVLRSLLHDEDPYVVIWAAPFSYNHFPDAAEFALKGLLEHSVGRIRGDAKQILEWQKRGILVTE
jgi:hypothetical protein